MNSGSDGAGLWVSSSRAWRDAKAAEEQAQAAQHQQHAYQHGNTPFTTNSTPIVTTARAAGAEHPSPAPLSSFELLHHAPAQPRKAKYSNRRWTSIVFNCVAGIHAVLFIVAVGLDSWTLADLEDNPLLGPSMKALKKIGATSALDIANKYQYWRLLVSPFLGAGVLHVWTNITAIVTCAMFCANDLPLWQIVLIYCVTGVSAVTTSANIGSRSVTAAGSGPAFGLIGAMVMLLLARYRRLRNHLVSWLLVVVNLTLQCFVGATPFVDNSGNTAGFVTGVLCCWAMLCLQKAPSSTRAEVRVQGLAAVLLCIALAIPVLGIIGLNTGLPLGGCCDAWVCAPSPWWNCEAAYAWPDSCQFSSFFNGTMVMTCPQGRAFEIPASLVNYGNASASVMDAVCSSFCTSAAPRPAVRPGPGA